MEFVADCASAVRDSKSRNSRKQSQQQPLCLPKPSSKLCLVRLGGLKPLAALLICVLATQAGMNYFFKKSIQITWLAVQMTRCALEIPIGLASGQRPVASDANGFASSSCCEWSNYVTQSQSLEIDWERGEHSREVVYRMIILLNLECGDLLSSLPVE